MSEEKLTDSYLDSQLESHSENHSNETSDKETHEQVDKQLHELKGSKNPTDDSEDSDYSNELESDSVMTSASENSSGSMDEMKQILDSLQRQMRQQKENLENTQAILQNKIILLQKNNDEVTNQMKEKDDTLVKAAEALKTMLSDIQQMKEDKDNMINQVLKDKEDLMTLYKLLSQVENSKSSNCSDELELT